MDKISAKFSKIYDKYIDKIYRFIYFKVDSEEISQDLTSETFLRAFEAFKTEKINNISAFLYKTAKNLIVDYYRQKKKQEAFVDFLRDPSENLEEKAILNSDLEKMKKTLLTLDEEDQNLLIWYYIEGISVKEIAKMLNKSENNVRVCIHRALKTLRDKINQTL
jgi:RNA polymerase sigma-70 factor (ECF subfamily)